MADDKSVVAFDDRGNASPPSVGFAVAACFLAVATAIVIASQVRAQQPKASPPNDERRQERDRFEKEAQELWQQGKTTEAIAAGEKLLAIERQVLGNEHANTLNSLEWLAERCLDQDDFDSAKEYRLEILATKTKLYGPKHWQVTDAEFLVRDTKNRAKLGPDGRRRLIEAESQTEEGFRLLQQRKFAEAVIHAKRALEIREQVLGPDHPGTALSHSNLAILYKSQQDFAAAVPSYKRALEIREKTLGPNHPATADSCTYLAMALEEQGNFADALHWYERALTIDEQVYGKEHPVVATCLNNLGNLYRTLGRHADAELRHKRALAIREKVLGNQHAAVALSAVNLAGVYKDQGRYADAESHYLRGLAIDEKTLGKDHPDVAANLGNLAGLYTLQGRYADAEPLYKRALAIDEKFYGKVHPAVSTDLNNLALLHSNQGRYTEAEPLFKRALAITEKLLGTEHADVAVTLNNLALAYETQGRHADAEPLFKRALAIWENALNKDHPAVARSLNNLAHTYVGQGKFAEAEPLFKRALAIDEKAFGKDHPDVASVLNNLALLYQSQAQFTDARPLFERALAIHEKALGKDHPDVAISLDNLGRLAVSERRPTEGAPLFARAARIVHQHLERTATIQSEQQQLTMSDKDRHFLDGYLSVTLDAHAPADEVYRAVLAWKGAVTARQHAMRRLRRQFDVQGKKDAAETFDRLIDATRELAHLTNLTSSKDGLNEYQQRLKDASERVEQLEQQLSRMSEPFRRELELHERGVPALRAALPPDAVLVDLLEYNHYGWFEDQQHERTTKPAAESQRAERKAPSVQRRVTAFVIRASGDRSSVERLDLGPVAPIAEAIERWRKSYDPDDAAAIRRLVWDKLPEDVRKTPTILISPDGALARFPWSALPGSKPGTFLIEEQAVAVIPVPQLLPELLTRKSAPPSESAAGAAPSLLLVGDVNFDAEPGANERPTPIASPVDKVGSGETHLAGISRAAPRGGHGAGSWKPLAGTKAEVTAVEEVYRRRFDQPREVAAQAAPIFRLTSTEATEARVRQLAPQCRYLHFATHGFFAPPEIPKAGAAQATAPGSESLSRLNESRMRGHNPALLSGLVLAGANRPVTAEHDDGILTALEVSALDLSDVELATLSACETGLGESAGGEGLLGLQRAFQVTGARTTVASLWNVSDTATRNLMIRFYRNLWSEKGMSRLEALREAQLWLMREAPKDPGLVRGLTLADERPAVFGNGKLHPSFWAAFVLSGDWR